MSSAADVLHLACAADDRYVAHSAAMIHSALTVRDAAEVQIHYLHGPAFAAGHARKLSEMVSANGGSLDLIEVADERVAGLPTVAEISSAMWYRILLPELLPDLAKVLYLDADTIAVDSLAPLWETELGDHLLGAVTNVFQADHLGRPAELGLAGPEVYFNSGVLLMNLDVMRLEQSMERVRRFALANRERLEWPDQDALNVVLGDRRLALAPRWNVMSSTMIFPWATDVYGEAAFEEAVTNPAIRHFEGPSFAKPWHPDSDRPMRDLYFEHRRATPWPRTRPDELSSPTTVAARARRRLRRRPGIDPPARS